MWILFGNKVKTELVPDGKRVERLCPSCSEVATFYERRVSSTLHLYYLDVFEYGRRRVMACGACNAQFAVDETDAEAGNETASGLGALADAATRASDAIVPKARQAASQIATAVRARLATESEPRPTATAADPDPLADEDEALEAKFRELEKRRLRIKDD